MMNPLPVDLDVVLMRDSDGNVTLRPAEEASEAESFHQIFVVSQAVAVSCEPAR